MYNVAVDFAPQEGLTMADKENQTMWQNSQSETITVSDLRAAPGDVLAQVQQGKTFSITKQGKVVASLAPKKDKNENN